MSGTLLGSCDPISIIKTHKARIAELKQVIDLLDQILKTLTNEQERLKQLLVAVKLSIKFVQLVQLKEARQLQQKPFNSRQIDNEIKTTKGNKNLKSKNIDLTILSSLTVRKKSILNDIFIWICKAVYGASEKEYQWEGFRQKLLRNEKFKEHMGSFSLVSKALYDDIVKKVSEKQKYLDLLQEPFRTQIDILLDVGQLAAQVYKKKNKKKQEEKTYQENQNKYHIMIEGLLYKIKMKEKTKEQIIDYINVLEPQRIQILQHKKKVQHKRNDLLKIIDDIKLEYEKMGISLESRVRRTPDQQKEIERERKNQRWRQRELSAERDRERQRQREKQRQFQTLKDPRRLQANNTMLPNTSHKSLDQKRLRQSQRSNSASKPNLDLRSSRYSSTNLNQANFTPQNRRYYSQNSTSHRPGTENQQTPNLKYNSNLQKHFGQGTDEKQRILDQYQKNFSITEVQKRGMKGSVNRLEYIGLYQSPSTELKPKRRIYQVQIMEQKYSRLPLPTPTLRALNDDPVTEAGSFEEGCKRCLLF